MPYLNIIERFRQTDCKIIKQKYFIYENPNREFKGLNVGEYGDGHLIITVGLSNEGENLFKN
jgi:hypothetical protein